MALEEAFLDGNTLMANLPASQGDEALAVRFYTRPRRDEAASLREGRPIYRDVEYVIVAPPGEKLNISDHPATDKDRRRFPRQYAAFKANAKADGVVGTRLSEWPMVSASQVEELKYFNCHTVEQLAAMPDGNLANVGSITALKKQAQDYLALAKGSAPTVQLRAELDQSRVMLEAMQRQMAEQAAIIAQLSAQAKAVQVADVELPVSEAAAPKLRRGPGRPPKTEQP